jgi:alpha-aminoadipate/glutamate carrier protein LysW
LKENRAGNYAPAPGPAGRAIIKLSNLPGCRIKVIRNRFGGFFMVECPVCDGKIDVDEEDVDEGETISCDECGAALKVVSKEPLELESAEEPDEDEEDEKHFIEDEEEEAEDEWK